MIHLKPFHKKKLKLWITKHILAKIREKNKTYENISKYSPSIYLQTTQANNLI